VILCHQYRAYSYKQYIQQQTHLIKQIIKIINNYMFRHGGHSQGVTEQRNISPTR
jgi:hypothetical protein